MLRNQDIWQQEMVRKRVAGGGWNYNGMTKECKEWNGCGYEVYKYCVFNQSLLLNLSFVLIFIAIKVVVVAASGISALVVLAINVVVVAAAGVFVRVVTVTVVAGSVVCI